VDDEAILVLLTTLCLCLALLVRERWKLWREDRDRAERLRNGSRAE
jgi:hypothetical protein